MYFFILPLSWYSSHVVSSEWMAVKMCKLYKKPGETCGTGIKTISMITCLRPVWSQRRLSAVMNPSLHCNSPQRAFLPWYETLIKEKQGCAAMSLQGKLVSLEFVDYVVSNSDASQCWYRLEPSAICSQTSTLRVVDWEQAGFLLTAITHASFCTMIHLSIHFRLHLLNIVKQNNTCQFAD